MKKRLFASILTLIMILSMTPISALAAVDSTPVGSGDDVTVIDQEQGEPAKEDNETVNTVAEITTQETLQQAINNSTGTKENPTTITISTNITLTSTLVIPNGKHIKIVGSTGNESVLTASGTSVSSFTRCYTGTTDSNEDGTNCQSMIIVGATEGSSDNISASLTIQNVKLDAGQYSEDLNASELTEQNTLRVVYIYGEDATFTMEEGSVVTGGTSYHRASGIFAQVGAIVINGGEVSNNVTGNNTSMNGAVGVEVGSITMSAGEVKNNTTTGVGGGLYGSADSKITITGGKICNNTAGAMGGGIASYGEVVISGGEISGNKSNLQGGGVFVTRDAGNLTISGDAKITNNEAGRDGGGVAATQNAVVVMNGGEISSNKTGTGFTGGGVYIGSVAGSTTSFTMNGGKITGNTAGNGNGNAVAVGVGTNKFVMTGGEISGNSLASGSTSGSTVYFAGTGSTQDSPTVFQMTGGSIQNNTSRGIDHVNYLTIELKGTPVITGNSLGSNTVNINCRYPIPQTQIRLIGELTSGANIGVYTYTYPSSSSFVQATTSETDTAYYLASAEYFKNDKNTSAVAVGNNTNKYVEFIAGTIRTITFDANTGNSSETSTQKVPNGKETALNANTFTRTGYTFTGWNTSATAEEGGTSYDEQGEITTSSDVTLYAQWKANEYDINYELNGGTAGKDAPEKHTYGNDTSLVDATRDGYEFGGWYTDSAMTGTKLTTLDKEAYTVNITLYAKWVKTVGEVTYFVSPTATDQTYTGSPIIPTVTVTDGNGDTVDSANYTVICEDDSNINVGTANVVVKVGETTIGTVSFEIVKATPNISITADPANLSGGGVVTLNVSGVPTEGRVSVTCDNTDYNPALGTNGKYTVTLPNETKSYTFKAVYDATSNYKATEAETNVQVTRYTSSSSSSSTTYNVAVDTAKNGTVSVSPKNASKGTTVTITAKPADGYEVDEVVVTDKNGGTVKVTAKGNDKYTFVMPAGKVDVEVTFVKETVTPSVSFTDVKSNAWYYDAAIYAAENGLMSGTGNGAFSPDLTTSRAMIWTILARVDGQNVSVTYGNWYDKAQSWAITRGVSDGTSPNAPITREQLAVMLYGFAKDQGYVTTGGVSLSRYVDASDVSAWAVEALEWAVGNGLISSMGSNILAPTGTATRAQVAVILMNFCETIVK